jgi:hypothetical protein
MQREREKLKINGLGSTIHHYGFRMIILKANTQRRGTDDNAFLVRRMPDTEGPSEQASSSCSCGELRRNLLCGPVTRESVRGNLLLFDEEVN